MNRSLAFYAIGDKAKALKDAMKAQQLGCNINPGFLKQLRQ